MNIDLNTLQGITFDGHDVQGLVYNGVTLWSKGGGSPTPSYDPYFTVECLGSGSIKLYRNGSRPKKTLYVWLNTIPNSDRSNYTSQVTATSNSEKIIISGLKTGDIVRLYGPDGDNHFGGASNSSYYYTFRFDMNVNISGDISSLINYNTTLKDYSFYRLFYTQTSIKNASGLILPYTTLASHCYDGMFYGCTNLTTTPTLPATTLANYCYYQMFRACSNLISGPDLPATTLADNCYDTMFLGCTNLTTGPDLPATTLATRCYYQMFGLCTNLTTGPDLPATNLTTGCYYGMFYNCSALNSIKCLATTNINNTNAQYFTYGITSSGTFTKAAGANWSSVTNGIPTGWTVIEE